MRNEPEDRVPTRVHDIIIRGNVLTSKVRIKLRVEEVLRGATTIQELRDAAAEAEERLRDWEVYESVNVRVDAGPPELPGTSNVVIVVAENPGELPCFSKSVRNKLGKRKIEEDEKPAQEGDDDCKTMTPDGRMRREPADRVPTRVHDIIIRGDVLIKSNVEELLRGATTIQELRHAAAEAEERLRACDVYESVNVRVDAGPPELPGTSNVVIEVSEPCGKQRSLSTGDIWDASGLGVLLPRYEAFRIPLAGQISLLSQDWLNFSSYKERALSLSFGNYDLCYNLSWTSLPHPYQSGYSLSSVLRYSFKIDQRDSPLRPTKGFAFHSTTHIGGPTHIGGLFPRSHSLRCIRQDVDLCYAIPLGFYGAALNLGTSAGVEFSSWEEGPAEPRRVVKDNMKNDNDVGRVYVDRDARIPLSASACLSFDLPLKVLRDAGIHGHVSAITCCSFRGFSLQSLMDSLHHGVKVGVTIPTRLFRMEVSYCHMSFGHGVNHQAKTGIAFGFMRH